MAKGFSGGFFLPAQRSIHAKGGFFAAQPTKDTHLPAHIPSATGSIPPTHDFPKVIINSGSSSMQRARNQMVDEVDVEVLDRTSGRTEASMRLLRPRQDKPVTQKTWNGRAKLVASAEQISLDNQVYKSHIGLFQPPPPAKRKLVTRTSPQASGDVNAKFQLAMQELDQIKYEYETMQKRQNSAPALVFAQQSTENYMKHGNQLPNGAANQPATGHHEVDIQSTSTQLATYQLSKDEASIPEDNAVIAHKPAEKNLNSPRQRLQVAEMVMRKLYKKNVQTEQQVAQLKDENAELRKKLARLEAQQVNTKTIANPETTDNNDVSNRIAQTQMPSAIERGRTNQLSSPNNAEIVSKRISTPATLIQPPTRESITRIDQQQLEYLRHLATEQDKTITALKIRIEDLSQQLTITKQQQPQHTKTASQGKTTPRQMVNKLQVKLQDALTESERQKHNYLKMKKDFQHLLNLKTKTLYENPAALNASTRELLQLMEKKLLQLDQEHSQNVSLYNSKLYEAEQQSCESYVQQKLMEEEIQRIAQDVQQRDQLDVQIEQCMVSVFDRLHQVEIENVQLKAVISGQ